MLLVVDPLTGFDEYRQNAMREWHVPGIAISTVKDDRVILSRGYRVREIGKSAAVDEHTIFAIGSTTKAMTATLAGMLVDEGKLRWDDPGEVPAVVPASGFVGHSPRDRSRFVHASHRSESRESAGADDLQP